MEQDTRLLGREAMVANLAALLLRGKTVLLYGPWGIGKTSILEALRRAVENQERPCGYSPETRALSDLTAALLRAYPEVDSEDRTQRRIRSTLRLAATHDPGVLFLDHLHDAGTQFKGYLRSLRGMGQGVLFAADVEDVWDHQRFRSMHLAYREMEVPPLANRYLHRILAEALAGKSLPQALSEADRSALIKAARGRPGWIVMMAERLQNSDYWSCGHVHVASLWASIMIEVKKKYFVQAESKKKSGGLERLNSIEGGGR